MQAKGNYLKIAIFFTIAFGVLCKSTFAAQWSYDDVASWPENFKECGGKMQSPINLPPVGPLSNIITTIYPTAPIIKLRNYRNFLKGGAKLVNNGHSVSIQPSVRVFAPKPVNTVIKNGKTYDYEPTSLHFHWGARSKTGSEHTINGTQYDLEMHIVHQNTDPNADAKHKLAVLGVLIQAVDKPKNISVFKKIVNKLPELKSYLSEAEIKEALNLDEILQNIKPKTYYSYQGSLTTPPCSETVTWFVFPHLLEISKAELNEFYKLKDSKHKPLLNTYRPVQPLGNRKVLYSNGI